jgi:uncharacterized protein with HEPN domain
MSNGKALRIQNYLEHIVLSVSRIQRYVTGLDYAAFLANEEKQDAIIRNLEIIGEAARNIQRFHPDFAAAHPAFPWGSAYGMRNALAHGYFSVDLDVVWKTVVNDLPALEQQARAILAEADPF